MLLTMQGKPVRSQRDSITGTSQQPLAAQMQPDAKIETVGVGIFLAGADRGSITLIHFIR